DTAPQRIATSSDLSRDPIPYPLCSLLYPRDRLDRLVDKGQPILSLLIGRVQCYLELQHSLGGRLLFVLLLLFQDLDSDLGPDSVQRQFEADPLSLQDPQDLGRPRELRAPYRQHLRQLMAAHISRIGIGRRNRDCSSPALFIDPESERTQPR